MTTPEEAALVAQPHEHEWAGSPEHRWCVECHEPHPANAHAKARPHHLTHPEPFQREFDGEPDP